jgi:hypothetical protein
MCLGHAAQFELQRCCRSLLLGLHLGNRELAVPLHLDELRIGQRLRLLRHELIDLLRRRALLLQRLKLQNFRR